MIAPFLFLKHVLYMYDKTINNVRSDNMTKMITLDALQDAIQTGTDAKILDVREPDEYNAGHIPESVNLPLSQIEDKVQTLDKNQEYIIICKKGGRALRAGDYLDQSGYNVTIAEQGMDDWTGEVKINA